MCLPERYSAICYRLQDRQMLKNEILKDLFFIERGYLNGNHFVYRSKAPVLIDTGYISNIHETERLINQLGVNLSDISMIINTHTHCDHIGANRSIQERSGCDIALHKRGHHFIRTRDDWSTWWKYYGQEAAFFKCTHALEDGDIVAVGPHELQVIHTPGHAADGIVLYNRKNKILVSSDTLWEADVAVMTLRVEGSAALFHMLESLMKLEELDVKTVYPGHGQPFFDMKKAISKARAKIDAYLNDTEKIGNDLLKKIMVYTLMMKKAVPQDDFFSSLMGTHWYKETVDLYFNSEYEHKYNETMGAFLKRGIVVVKNGNLCTTVKP